MARDWGKRSTRALKAWRAKSRNTFGFLRNRRTTEWARQSEATGVDAALYFFTSPSSEDSAVRFRPLFPILMPLLVLAGMGSAAHASGITAAVDDPTRLTEHRERDADRKPGEVLAFALDGPTDDLVIADVVPGSGYYTAILSRMVGETGKIYAVNPTRIFEAFPNARNGFPEYLEQDPRDNVDYSVQKLDEFSVAEPLDAAIMILYYHDTIWTGEDRAVMNRRIFDALKPGGVFLVVDHHAAPGAGDEVTKALHRMEASVVAEEVPRAGFEFVGESALLSHPSDPRTDSVFDPAIRGKTDRFIYLYRKPR